MTTLNESSDSQLKQELFVLTSLCDLVDSKVSETVKDLLQKEAYEEYLGLEIDYEAYDDPQKFADDYLLIKLLSKSPNLPTGFDRTEEAELSFLDSEITCYFTNKRVRAAKIGDEPSSVFSIRRMINSMLPELGVPELEEISRGFSHGPGGTTGVRGVGTCVVDKYERKMHHTIQLAPFVNSIIGPRWAEFLAASEGTKIVEGGKFTTVPKNAKTDRGISIEPTLNVYVQKGIGKYIRKRLRRFGIDLNHQSEINADLARRAYSENLSTIDLSAASDSVSLALVELLFPEDWVKLLMLCRSPRTNFAEAYRPLQKLSSMGNGYTFELESLIFWAICKACVPPSKHHLMSVYGDDIVVPRESADDVIDALKYLGFSVNGAKSFLAGNFFESCGTDWFKGVPVRPFHLKGARPGIPYLVTIANKLRLYAKRRGYGVFCDLRYKPLWDILRKNVPAKWANCIVPEYFGDIGLIGDSSELTNWKATSGQIEGRFIRTISTKPFNREYSSYGVLLDKLACNDTSSTLLRNTSGLVVAPTPRNNESETCDDKFATYPLRGRSKGVKPRWTLVTTWSNGLEWLSLGHSKITVTTD